MSGSDVHRAEELRDALTKAVGDKPVDNSKVLSILGAISELKVTADILTKTKLGKVVNIARKRPGVSTEGQTLAKKLARDYKALMDKAGPAKTASGADERRSSVSSSIASSASGGSTKPTASVQHAAVTMNIPKTDNPTRDALRKILCQALCTDGPHDAAPAVAAGIETGVFEKVGYPNGKSKIKMLVSNLKNKDNAQLRTRALSQEIPSEKFATMTAEDLASDKVKATKAAAAEQFLRDKALATKEGAHTTEYPCPKCKARDCIYTQLQTRSADEPMTTFCCCKQCGTRWKFC